MTFFRIFAETLAPGVKVRETADCETPANRATSRDDEYFFLSPYSWARADHASMRDRF